MTAPHGTLAAYKSGCRGSKGCTACRAANAAYVRERRRHQYAIGLTADSDRHGEPSTYTEWGCRCAACRSAAAKGASS